MLFGINLDNQEKSKLDEQSKKENFKSVSTWARKTLLDYIDNQNKQEN